MKTDFSKVIYKIGEYSPKQLKKLYNQMPQARKDRVDKIDNVVYKEFLIVEFFIVTRKLKRNKSEDFLYNNMGKPYFNNSRIEFSISHSENLLIVAFSKNKIGVDLQHYLHFDEKLAQKICNEEELQRIFNSKDKDKTFTMLWTQKESIVKLLGVTLYDDIRNVLNNIEKYKLITVFRKNFVTSICIEK